jgi:hypothetical protein
MDNDGKITNIDHLDILTNGTVDEIRNSVTNPNQIGYVINTKTNEQISQITPVIIIINQGLSDLDNRINALSENGADMNMKIDYYGTQRSANEIYQMRKI